MVAASWFRLDAARSREWLVRLVNAVLMTLAVLAISAALNASPSNASSTPVAAYSFDEGEGEVAEDLAGEHDGALENTEWVKGKYGSAIYLDGDGDDLVRIADSPELQLSEEFTLEAWVRPDSARTEAPVIEKQTSNFYSYKLSVGGETAGLPEGFVADKAFSWEEVAAEEALTSKAWSHLAMTYDGAAIRLYVNGELLDTNYAPGPQGSEGALLIGADDAEDAFKGRIDEVRIYDRALDAGEVAADKAAPIQTPPSPPVAAYSFDEGEGEVAEDLAGEHDGALENTEWVKGKYGSAIYLDGFNDYVEVPDAPELQLTEEFTLEAWVRPESLETQAVAISKEATSSYSYQLFVGSREEAGIPEGFLGYEPSASKDVKDENPLVAKTWNHLALTYDGANLRLYVNGELVDTESSPPAQASVGPLIFGGNDDEEFFKGRIDEVRIYDRARSTEELQDIKGPYFWKPFEISAIRPPGSIDPIVLLPGVTDPPAADGSSGSGLDTYSYRYAPVGKPFGSWLTTTQSYFDLPGATEGDAFTIEVYVTDKAGNRSEVKDATLSIPPEDDLPPMSEEEQNELENANEEDVGVTELSTARESNEEKGNFAPLIAGSAVVCSNHYGNPHESSHRPGRINVVARIRCNHGPIQGVLRAHLYRNDVLVASSGERKYLFLAFEFKVKASAFANVPCKSGVYRSITGISRQYPPNYKPPFESTAKISPPIRDPCS
jgi:hypothetical protein